MMRKRVCCLNGPCLTAVHSKLWDLLLQNICLWSKGVSSIRKLTETLLWMCVLHRDGMIKLWLYRETTVVPRCGLSLKVSLHNVEYHLLLNINKNTLKHQHLLALFN